ncbi:hypothetical protein PHLGIDRAFT_119693 [Phlebiopsis gigantea 11061_1 CR5-6]|uniref:Very-long-chain (3R)-3-hydroxyacyl-CoA dehydratase n=1 Tax=Phlebiopsis gigantea (strain 11061_1 CR5-6) TaxID=745531 RepID=A0A0C3NKQ5_PHLG1|nr:hypothetical protein PHLGIDRAFT_119693 [Phlebiopsis gigantea 11061_1 CR5-6]
MAMIEEIPDSPVAPPAKIRGGPPPLVKYYLVAFNTLSAIGWFFVLAGTVFHLVDGAAAPGRFSATLAGVLGLGGAAGFEQHVPAALVPLVRRAATTYAAVGRRTTLVQTLAVLEVVHSLLGWVRSPLATVSMQVASRLFVVWGINHFFPSTHVHPAYASMVLSWSLTEVIRYEFYACTLLGAEPFPLLWLRYTTFYVLYPTGASSEAALIFSTLPPFSDLAAWGLTDIARGALFCIWWPSLYVLYTHMMKQRRRVLGSAGPGRTLGAKPKSQ